jgi:hypothetical protein
MAISLAHAAERLRDRRTYPARLNSEELSGLRVRQAEVIVGDDDLALPTGQKAEEPPRLEPIQQLIRRIVGLVWA